MNDGNYSETPEIFKCNTDMAFGILIRLSEKVILRLVILVTLLLGIGIAIV